MRSTSLNEEVRRALVTGGAGFIGSHLVDALMESGVEVVVLDNLSRGRLSNISRWIGHPKFSFSQGDLLRPEDIDEAIEGCDVVFHLAANPEVRLGAVDPKVDYEQNILATYNLLEAMRRSRSCRGIVFASTSTVYGEAEVLPTPEGYAPLRPISLYGASKLACESLICGYSHMFGYRSVILRLANIVGPRSNHGVVYDFLMKLRANPKALEVLGDGTQAKSYLHISDCVEAFLIATQALEDDIKIFNVGSEDRIDVLQIARIVAEELGLREVELNCTGGIDGGRGWRGDVKRMQLDITRLKLLGWQPRWNSAQAIRLAVKGLIEELGGLNLRPPRASSTGGWSS